MGLQGAAREEHLAGAGVADGHEPVAQSRSIGAAELAFVGGSCLRESASELVDEAREMRIELDRPVASDLIEAPPSGVRELRLVGHKRCTVGPCEHEPETHVGTCQGV